MGGDETSARLYFRGLQPTTLVDYPDEVACTFFLGGCNWRCGYCYNVDVVQNDTGMRMAAGDALAFLDSRQAFLDAVCVTGGEPLLQYDALRPFIEQVKTRDLKIKLDTNGSQPASLAALLDAELLDYVAMDIKGPLNMYPLITGAPVDIEPLIHSVRLIQQSGVEYEFRTTVISRLTLDDFDQIGQWLRESRRYYLQPVQLGMPLLDADFTSSEQPVSSAFLEDAVQRLRAYIEDVRIRT
jgi:pyruvate formate lyase activating enzyme